MAVGRIAARPLLGVSFAVAAGFLPLHAAGDQPERAGHDDRGYYTALDVGDPTPREAEARPQLANHGAGGAESWLAAADGSSGEENSAAGAGILTSQAAPPSGPKWRPHIDLEGKLGTDRDLGEADVFLPLWQNGTSMLFGNVKARLDDNASREGNFGLGVRHLLEAGWNLGTYGYFDRRKTEHDNYFNQVTVGAEALSLNWDFRVNTYLPQGRRSKNVDSLNTAEVSGTTVLFRGGEERSLTGFDGEIGWRVPMFAADAGRQFRVYGGAYRFYTDDVNPVQGPRARAELTFDEVPYLWEGSRLTLGAEGQHDGPRGGQAFAVARLRVPLQIFADGQSRLTPLERRMTDPVVRDVDVVSQAGTTFTAPETVTATAGGSTITVLSSATTTGAALPGAITAAGANSTVILSGSFSTTTNVVTPASGQTVMGAGSLTVRSPSGRTATLTTSGATIAGTVSAGNAATVEITNNNSTLTGLTVTNTLAAGTVIAVHVGAVSGTTISNNAITATRTAAGANPVGAINLPAASNNTTISGNTLTATASGGAGSETQGIRALGSPTNVTASGNTFNASGSALATNDNTIKVDAGAASFVTAASTGNVVVNGNHNCLIANTTGSVSFTNGTTCP